MEAGALNMKHIARLIGLGAVALAAAQATAADLKIGFISSLSGPVSALGIPYEKGIRAAIADGTYQVSPERIADKLMRLENELA